jgi:hypothetical protein
VGGCGESPPVSSARFVGLRRMLAGLGGEYDASDHMLKPWVSL